MAYLICSQCGGKIHPHKNKTTYKYDDGTVKYTVTSFDYYCNECN